LDPSSRDERDIEYREDGSVVLEPLIRNTTSTPDCEEILVRPEGFSSRHGQSKEPDIPIVTCRAKKKDWREGLIRYIPVSTVEQVFEDLVSLSWSVMQFSTGFLIVTKVREQSCVMIETIWPIRIAEIRFQH